MMRFKLYDPPMTPYLYLCLQTNSFLESLQDSTTGSDLPHITGTGVAEFTFPYPPPEEQQEIVRRVEALFKLVDAIEQRVATAPARADKLTQAILAKAFRGELVPTDAELARREGRDYEPASALLERIRAERADSSGSAKRPAARRKS
jgi:type I restriction enzyme S subunit